MIGRIRIIGIVAARLGMDVDLILSSSRQKTVSLARSIICCLAVDQLMLSGTFVSFRMLDCTPLGAKNPTQQSRSRRSRDPAAGVEAKRKSRFIGELNIDPPSA